MKVNLNGLVSDVMKRKKSTIVKPHCYHPSRSHPGHRNISPQGLNHKVPSGIIVHASTSAKKI